jgi:hypothetical protein
MSSNRCTLSLTCSARVPEQDDPRNFLMSEECLELEWLGADLWSPWIKVTQYLIPGVGIAYGVT